MRKRTPFKGGFSEWVYYAPEFQNYIAPAAANRAKYGRHLIFGYIGSTARNSVRDRIVETALREKGLSPNGVALRLTHTAGRHMMDHVGRHTSTQKFRRLVQDYLVGI